MHEMSLCESVLRIMEDHAKAQGFARIRTVWLEIGSLSGVEPDAIRFCFDVVTRGTLADQAKLVIIETPGQAWCVQCSNAVRVTRRFDACPSCGGYQLQVTAGEAMRVKELEVE